MREGLDNRLSRSRVHRRLLQRRWQRVVSVLGCIVVFCVTYALILPAITLTNKTPICGMEEHAHTDDCYEQVLACGLEESEGHAHTDACYDEEGNLTCGLEESAGHVHDESCYEQRLTCELEEHAHTDACYPAEEDEPEPEDETAAAAAIKLEQKTDTVRVTVEAPEGALPEGTTLKLKDMESEDYLDAVREATRLEELTAENVMAVDITFLNKAGDKVEPTENVKVSLTKRGEETGIAKTADVVHIKDDGKGELVKSEVVKTDDEKGVEEGLKDDKVAFESDKFSVYVVVDPPSTEDAARATVNFYGANGEVKATFYIKNGDTAEALEDIIYDPGIGTLGNGLIFRGWNIGTVNTNDGANYTTETEAMTIEDVRAFFASDSLTITEGDVYNIYPVIYKGITVSYLGDNNVVIGATTELVPANDPSASTTHTVNMSYTPPTSTQQFQGWHVNTGSSNIVGYNQGDEPYANGTELTITGNVVFSPTAPTGHWLVFDEVQKGATYNAPEFVKDGETTAKPCPDSEMACLGYTFDGWYADKGYSRPFTFGGELTDNTTIYAKWKQNSTAHYTVIIWKENLDGTGYDYAESLRLSGNVNSTVNSITQRGSGNDAYARINGTNYQYTGFHLENYDQNVTITPEGNAVVNVYYDRNEYTLTFTTGSTTQGVVTYVYGGWTYSDARVGSAITNQGYISTFESNKRSVGSYEVSYRNGSRYAIKIGGTWYEIDSNGYYVYNATRINSVTLPGDGVVKTITALYGQNISENFPIDWPGAQDGDRWKPGSNNLGWTEVMVFIDSMPAGSVTFTLDRADRPLKTMYYYVEALEGDTGTVTHKGVRYKLYSKIDARYNGVTEEDYVELDGFTKRDVTAQINGNTLTKDGIFYIYSTTQDQSIYFFYSRDKYSINYMDGAYFDGNGNVIESESNRGQLGASGQAGVPGDAEIYYGADVSSYGDATSSDYYAPSYTGYTFAGWYADRSCTHPYDFDKMPKNGITVYAKWVQNQYRVFLHPNALINGAPDASLSWGQDDSGNEVEREMSFRVPYNSRVSVPTGTRSEYELIGWYLDEACTQIFNADNYVLNDTSVTESYDQTTTMTDTIDKWGILQDPKSNSDYNNNRFWITKQLNLYAKWRAVLVGAEGIGVVYDANGGTNPPSDSTQYLDQAQAIAQAASTAPDENQQFLYWCVQRWDESAGGYVDTDTYVYPGDTFTVLKDHAQVVENPDSTPANPSYTYTVQLKAVYGDKDAAAPTHITWYGNGGTINQGVSAGEGYSAVTEMVTTAYTNLQINEAVPIAVADTFKRDGYIFKGWAREVEPQGAFDKTLENPIVESAFSEKSDLKPWLKYENGNFYELQDDGVTYGSTPVTYVAADEIDPYHALYAVWEKTPVVKIIKVDKDNNDKPLPGAVFSMAQGQTTLYEGLTSGTDGYLATGGASSTTQFTLPVGSYTLSETTPPTGYNPATGGVTITVNDSAVATDQRVTYAQADDNQGVSNVATYDATTETYTVTITNSAGATLPSAGGPGTTSFTLLGAMLVVFSVAMAGLTNKARLADALRARRRGGDAKR